MPSTRFRTSRFAPARVAASAALSLVTAGALLGAVGVPAASEEPAAAAWPGSQSVTLVDRQAYFGTDVSGLDLKVGAKPADDVLWAVDDREGLLLRLVQRSGVWLRDSANGWGSGKRITFPDGRRPDAEGVVVVDGWAYVSTERDDTGRSRPSVIRVATSGSSTTLKAAAEWHLGADFSGIGANVGLEAISYLPDSFLRGAKLRDERTGKVFDPALYPDRVGGGLFLVAAEAASHGGTVHAYALNRNGLSVRVASIANPLGLVMDLAFDRSTQTLWMACDDDCAGQVAVARPRSNGDGTTSFVADAVHRRPSGLPDHNNEGFTVAPTSRCVGGLRPVYWSNDANDGGRVLRRGMTTCPTASGGGPGGGSGDVSGGGLPPVPKTPELAITAPSVRAGQRATVTVRVSAAGVVPDGDVKVRVGSRTGTATVVDGRASVTVPAFRTAGWRDVEVTYGGDIETAGRTRVSSLEVRRAGTRITYAKPPRTAPGARARVAVRVRAAVATPGRVRVTWKGQKVKATVTRRGSKAVLRFTAPRTEGRHRLVVRYAGSRSTSPSRRAVVLRVG